MATTRSRRKPPALRESHSDHSDAANLPELIIGLAAGVGAPLESVQAELGRELSRVGYRPDAIHLSELTKRFDLATPFPRSAVREASRIDAMMNRGNEAREQTGRSDILALAAVGEIRVRRGRGPTPLVGRALILRQLKHPDEVFLLRRTYGDGFLLLGIHCPRNSRERHLRRRGCSSREVARLIERDEHEPSDVGQHLRDTFHLSDVFVEVSDQGRPALANQIRRFLELLLGLRILGPTVHEFGMFQAYANALRSTQLGRQVGAAIVGPTNELLAVGTNEVPRHGGGVYWEGDPCDARDHQRGRDSSDALREEIVREITERLDPSWGALSHEERQRLVRQNLPKLRSTTVSALTEFGRAVHAEAEAIVSAARKGISIRGACLYCTTFPCHVCAKHIVSAGIEQVFYIEPYPKSRALQLFDDSISVEEEVSGRVFFRPFVGVAPRRYVDFFSMRTPEGTDIRRKDSAGNVIHGQRNPRLQMPYLSALDRENAGAADLKRIIRREGAR